MNYEVVVSYTERNSDTLFVEADDPDMAEYNAINMIRDSHDIGMSDVEILEVRAIG